MNESLFAKLCLPILSFDLSVNVPFFGFLSLMYSLDIKSSAILVFDEFISLIAVLELIYLDHCLSRALLEMTSSRALGILLL